MIRAYEFVQGKADGKAIEPSALGHSLTEPGAFVWVDFEKSSSDEAMPILEGVFHFHPLAIEDCIADSPTPKVEEYLPQADDKFAPHLFLVMHGAKFRQVTGSFAMDELNMFLGKNFLVTYHDQPMSCITAIEERCKKGGPNVTRGPDRLAHAMLDQLVDDYRPALHDFSDQITGLEERAALDPDSATVQDITRTKKELMRLRQTITPQAEVLTRLARGEFSLIRPHLLPYYRDVSDALGHLASQAQGYTDSLTATLQVYLSTASNRTNDIVKLLTLITVLTTPLMVVSTWYGMNFKNMPELDWRYGYAIAALVVAVSTIGAFWYFKMKKWF